MTGLYFLSALICILAALIMEDKPQNQKRENYCATLGVVLLLCGVYTYYTGRWDVVLLIPVASMFFVNAIDIYDKRRGGMDEYVWSVIVCSICILISIMRWIA